MSAKTETRPALKINRTTVRTGVRAGGEEGTVRPIRGPAFTTTVHGYTETCM